MQPKNITDVGLRVWEIQVTDDMMSPWDWCRAHVETGKFYSHYGLMRSGPSTYWFVDPMDALAFSLYFGPKVVKSIPGPNV